MKKYFLAGASIITLLVGVGTIGCGSDSSSDLNVSKEDSALADDNDSYIPVQTFTKTTSNSVLNQGAYVTSQCYTKTEDSIGGVHNPCFTCHINSQEPNYVNDPDLQVSYAMSEYTKTNRFANLFKDRTDAVSAIADNTILEYVRENNYMDENNTIILAAILKNVPEEWDYDGDGKWSGYSPDCYFNFDSEGFDKSLNGSYTGWRAFGYYPFLGTFWPTNGSTDDVLIRLPESMRQDSSGKVDLEVYKINLAIVEALIKKSDIVIEPVDEKSYGVDLNQNGVLDSADTVVYNWETPSYDVTKLIYYDYSMEYVGKANSAQIANTLHMAPGLYPEGTEFLHTVRYIDVDEEGNISMSKRMKELRYGVKNMWLTYPQLKNIINIEAVEKIQWPDRLRTIIGNSEIGLDSGQGWSYQGFIEDKEGWLRPQTHEETLYCIGCHSGIGATVDTTFVFPRKFDHNAKQMGWYHWAQSQNGFKNIPEPILADGRYEYTLYLEQNNAGDEFRDNEEVIEKFFDENSNLKQDQIDILHDDISHLIVPTSQRALMLNKAYKVIVDEQSYIYGREPHVTPVSNIHESVEVDQETGNSEITMERYPLQQ